MSPNETLDFIFDLYGIKNEEVAKKSGVHKSIISKYRNGRSDMGTEKLQKILRVLPTKAIAHFNAIFVYGIEPDQSLESVQSTKTEISYKDTPKKILKAAEPKSEYKV